MSQSASRTILCVDLGNICQSVMFSRFLQQALATQGKNHRTVISAGLFTFEDLVGRPPEPHAVTAMREKRLDISCHRSRRVHEFNLSDFDLIFCMNNTQQEGLLSLGAKYEQIRVVSPPRHGLPNPVGQPNLPAFRSCAHALEQLAQQIAASL